MTRNTKLQRHPHGEQLSSYGDGMLDVATTHSVAEHLRDCAPCRHLVSQLDQTRTLLGGLPAPPRPGPEFWNDTYRRLRVDDLEKAAPRRMPWASLRGTGQATHRRWVAGLTAAAVVAAAMVVGPTITPTPSTVQPSLNSSRSVSTSPSIAQAQDETPDVSALVESHTDSVARQPLSDPDRQKMIAADVRQVQDTPQGAANADGAF